MENNYIKLTQKEKIIMNSYISMVDGLGIYLGDGYEIILHSLENLHESVIKIVNGFHSGRKEGAPITDFALGMLAKIQKSKDHSSISYFNKNVHGVILKSTTIPITGDKNRIIGLLCINFYTDTPISAIIKNFTPPVTGFSNELEPTETFAEDIDDLLISTLKEAKDKILNNPSVSTTNKNKEIIAYLYVRGIFNLKDSVIKVANLLGISKNTVYMHIRNLQKQ